jgi:hypothetical protein
VIEDVPKEEFEALYPKSDVVTSGFERAGEKAPGWVGTDTVRVAEYWRLEGGLAEARITQAREAHS